MAIDISDSPVAPQRAATADATGTAREARSVRVQVLATRDAARDALTFVLALPGTQRAPAAYRAGQFITLALPIGGATYYRSYSLCGAGSAEAPWEITVKRAQGGVCSNALVDHLRPGMVLRACLPQGTFTLPSALAPDTALVFVAAGSGITPIYSMLRALACRDHTLRPRVQLHYAYHSPADAIFGRELAALDPEHVWLTQYHYVATHGQRLSAQQVVVAAGAQDAGAEWFICGPADLKQQVVGEVARQGVPEARIHTEVFASPASAAARGAYRPAERAGISARVRLAENGAALDARPGETLLETLERHGYRPEFSCRAGACSTCRMRLLAGQVRDGAGQSGALTPAERAQGDILACVAQPLGDVTLAAVDVALTPPHQPPAMGTAAEYARTAGATGRARKRRGLRLGLAAAAVGLFASTWGLTSHGTFTQTASASTSASGSTNSSGSSATSPSGTSSSSSSSGSSGLFTTQPSQSSPNTSTGVS